MKKITSPEICLRYTWGISDLTDPYFQSAVLRYRLTQTMGTTKLNVAQWTTLIAAYTALGVISGPLMLLTHLKISIGFLPETILVTGLACIMLEIYLLAKMARRLIRYNLLVPIKQIGLSADGIRLLSHFMSCSERGFFRWDEISEIKLGTSDFIDYSPDGAMSQKRSLTQLVPKIEPCIELRNVNNKVVKLRLSAIRSIEERRVFVEMIRKYARKAADKDDISQILRVNNIQDIAFTQLWSNALKSQAPRLVADALPVSTTLQEGRFMIKKQIGGGGQGAIYEAEMMDSAGQIQVVALKEYVLPDQEHLFDRKRAIEQFEREVHLLARLKHPSIIGLIDAFVEDHRAYLAMDLIAGQTIKDLANRKGGLAEVEVVKISLKLCEILRYMHELQPQVVHLDVTPDNVIVRSDSELMLLDFNTSSDGSGLRTKLIAGKQKYMSPEQFRNEISPLCDIYALGCTMFYMLTGVEAEPLTKCDVFSHRTNVNPILRDCIASATELEGSQRLQTVQAMENQLLSITRKN